MNNLMLRNWSIAPNEETGELEVIEKFPLKEETISKTR